MMKKTKEFNNILDECLERLMFKGESIEQCLQSYPEQANELEPLLRTASFAASKTSAIKPRPEFREKARYQFRAALHEAERKKGHSLSGWRWQPRWMATITAVMVLLLGGSSTVAAAGSSMPDSPLYGVKLATETVRVSMACSAMDKAELLTALADKRVAEIVYLADKGKLEQVERTAHRLNHHLMVMAELAGGQKEDSAILMSPDFQDTQVTSWSSRPGNERGPEGAPFDKKARLRMMLSRYAAEHPEELREALRRAPPPVQPALWQAIAISESGYEQALNALDEQE